MNPCARCHRPEAEPPHRYCDHCAHVMVDEYERTALDSVTRLLAQTRTLNSELERGHAEKGKS